MKRERDNRLLLLVLLFIITICGISYSRIRKKSPFLLEGEKETLAMGEDIALTELGEIQVEIDGAVRYPGMYQITEGYTLGDVIEQAGGLQEEAKEEAIDLSWHVFQGEHITIPKQEEELARGYSQVYLQEVAAAKEEEIGEAEEKEETAEDVISLVININTAEQEELMLLPGIGEKLAENIILYREEHGAFQTIEDIQNVSKIGAGIFEKIKGYITT